MMHYRGFMPQAFAEKVVQLDAAESVG